MAVFGLLVIIAGIAFTLLLTRASAIASHVASRVLPQLSREVGYDIHVGAIDASVFPLPYVQASDLVVSGAAGEPALLRAERLRASVMLWPLVRSFGQEVHVSAVTVEGATVSVVTRRDGSSNLAKLVSYWAELGRETPSWQLDSAAVRSARLFLVDLRQNSPSLVSVEAFEADCKPCAVRAAVELRGALAAVRPNVSAKLAIDGGAFRGTFTATDVDVAKLKAALPGQSAELVSGGKLSAFGQLATDAKGIWGITGGGTVDRLLVGEQPVHAAFQLQTTVDLGPSGSAPLELPSLSADRFVIGLIEIKDIRAQATATREGFRVIGLTGQLAGGTVTASEMHLDLRTKEFPWTLRGAANKMDMAKLGQIVGVKMPVTGQASSSFDVAGAGLKWDSIRPSLVGSGRFDVDKPMVTAQTSGTLTQAIRAILNSFAMGALFPELGAMSVAPFGAPFHVDHAVVRLDEAVAFRTHIGDAVLKGTIGLDQRLALGGSATLRWTPISTMKAHAATVPIAIRGTLSSPTLEVTATPRQLVGAIAGAAPTLPEIQAEAKRRLETWLGGKR